MEQCEFNEWNGLKWQTNLVCFGHDILGDFEGFQNLEWNSLNCNYTVIFKLMVKVNLLVNLKCKEFIEMNCDVCMRVFLAPSFLNW